MVQLDQDEKIIFQARKHWFFLLKELAPLIPLILLPLLIAVLVGIAERTNAVNTFIHIVKEERNTRADEISEAFDRKNSANGGAMTVYIRGNVSAFFAMLFFLWLVLVWVAGFIIWTDYYLDVLVVTNKRVIDIDQRGLFSRDIASFRLDKIQDISIGVSGIVATFLKFGTIKVQTAGEMNEFIIRYIARPEEIKTIISREHDRVVEKMREVRLVGNTL